MSINPRHTSLSYRQILSVAFPIMIGVFIQYAVSITDSAFLNRISPDDFNAAGNAGMLYITLFMVAMGIASGAQIMIARRDGEGNYAEAGQVFRQTLFTLISFSLLLVLLLQSINWLLLPSFVHDPVVTEKMQTFLHYRGWGLLFAVTTLAYQGLYAGIARTRVIMYYTSLTAFLNVVLDYGLIFGHFGLPRMELEGAAIASVIAEAGALLFVILYTRYDKAVLKYRLRGKLIPIRNTIVQLIKLSWPLMLQGFVATGAWTVFFFFIEQMGSKDLEISQVIRMFYLIAFIPIQGIGAATRTFVSQLIARGQTREVLPTVTKIILLNLLATLIFTHPNLLYPLWVVPVMSENTAILQETAYTLQVVTGAMFLLALTAPLLNLISGSGDTKTAFRIELLTIVLYLTGAWLLTGPLQQNIIWVWCIEYVYFGTMALGCIYYIRRGKWKHIKV